MNRKKRRDSPGFSLNNFTIDDHHPKYRDKPNEQIKQTFDSIYKNWIWGGDNVEPEAGGGGSGGG